jgi:cation diffusion facilitator CzcD-associated flavoprotein CzcO
MHSAEYKSPSQWKGKAGVIIGTANTGQILQLFGSCFKEG